MACREWAAWAARDRAARREGSTMLVFFPVTEEHGSNGKGADDRWNIRGAASMPADRRSRAGRSLVESGYRGEGRPSHCSRRLAQVEPLAEVHPELAKGCNVARRQRARRSCACPNPSQARRPRRSRGGRWRSGAVAHELAADLQEVDRQVLEIEEGAKARSEVVQSERQPSSLSCSAKRLACVTLLTAAVSVISKIS